MPSRVSIQAIIAFHLPFLVNVGESSVDHPHSLLGLPNVQILWVIVQANPTSQWEGKISAIFYRKSQVVFSLWVLRLKIGNLYLSPTTAHILILMNVHSLLEAVYIYN